MESTYTLNLKINLQYFIFILSSSQGCRGDEIEITIHLIRLSTCNYVTDLNFPLYPAN
jgi:hypothetical protein